jgi:hypothetical protein
MVVTGTERLEGVINIDDAYCIAEASFNVSNLVVGRM